MEAEITERAKALQEHSAFVFRAQPKYILDFSWPTVGLLQLYLAPLLGKQKFSKADEGAIDQVACYLGCMAADYWTLLSEGKTAVTLSGPEITITGKGGPLLPKRGLFEVNISRELRQILSTPKDPFPVLADWHLPKTGFNLLNDRSNIFRYNLISAFALGLFTGLCPYGKGPWAEKTVEEWAECLAPVHLHLSTSSAKYYSRCFPLEPMGAEPQAYLSGLIFPPMGAPELPDYFGNIHLLLGYLKDLEKQEILSLAKNLSFSPDPTFATCGFLVGTSLCEETGPFMHQADVLRPYWYRLLPNVAEITRVLSHGFSWPDLMQKGLFDQAKKALEREIAWGLLPETLLSARRLANKNFHPVFESLRTRTLTESFVHIERLYLEGSRETDIVQQYILLQIMFAQYTGALANLQECFLQKDDFYCPSDRLRLLSVFAQLDAPKEIILPWLKDTVADLRPPFRGAILLDSAVEQLILLGEPALALKLANMILDDEPSAIRIRYLRYRLCQGTEVAEADLEYLLRHAPMLPEIFTELHRQQLLRTV